MSDNWQENQLYHIFLNVSKLAFKKTHNELEKIDLYRGQPPLLFALWEKDGRSRKELCDLLDLKPATITKMTKRLEKSDFVFSKQDENDSRIARVYLTNKGKEIQSRIQKIYTDLESVAFKNISQEEKEIFKRILGTIKKNLKEV